MSQLKIFVADPHPNSRLALQMWFDNQPGMRIVGISVDSDDLVGQVGVAQPNVVLLDWDLVASNPFNFIKNLHSLASHPTIIVLDIQPETREAAFAAGADEFSSKDQSPEQLRMILRNIKQKMNDQQKIK